MVQEEIKFKRFFIWSYGGPPFGWSGTICANLKEGIMGNILVKLYEIWKQWFKRCCLKKKFADDGWTEEQTTKDGQRSIIIAHFEPSAQVS